jgi:saccharopine dehydrogenase (NAD+, L-lysine forming)
MRARILVVGGYGAVGAHLCRALAAQGGVEIVAAGRRLDRAAALAAELNATGRRLDLDDPATWEGVVKRLDLVVMCMDQKSTAFVEYLFARGIGYVDITAEDRLFRRIERLPPRSAAMLSVGLAPGLTNLLATDAAAQLDSVERIAIGILTGLGDAHGTAGKAWTAQRMFDPAEPRASALLDFGAPWGRRRAHSVGFADQHALARTLRIPVTTRLAFESRLATAATFGLARLFCLRATRSRAR